MPSLADKSHKPVLPRELFLSHSSLDRRFADKLAATLRSHHIPTWYGPINVAGAQQWHDEIGMALRRCDWFALILTPSSVKSEWVKRELLWALNDSRFNGRIIPVLCRKCCFEELSWTLPQLQQIDFRRRYHDACRELFRIWGIGYDPRRGTYPADD